MAIRKLQETQQETSASITRHRPPPQSAPRDDMFVHVGKALLDTLERVGFGGMVIDANGYVLNINAAAHKLLRDNVGGSESNEADWLRHASKRLLDRASPWLPRNVGAWVTIPGHGDRPLALHRIPLVGAEGYTDCVVLILADLAAAPQPSPAPLRRIFGLTAAEAKLAIQILQGETPADIARIHHVSVATVRSQLASVFAKTQTRRQSELVMLLTRIAILP